LRSVAAQGIWRNLVLWGGWRNREEKFLVQKTEFFYQKRTFLYQKTPVFSTFLTKKTGKKGGKHF
jgi:hypothetical protein